MKGFFVMRSRLIQLTALILLIAIMLPLAVACSKEISYEVEFKVDGITYQTVPAKKPSELTLPPDPTKEGHTFVGWFYDENVWTQPFKPEELPTESKEKELKYTVYALFSKFTPNTDLNQGDQTMADKFHFQLKEVNSAIMPVTDFSSGTPTGSTTSITVSPDGVPSVKWTATTGGGVKFANEASVKAGSVLKFSIYSEKATKNNVQLRISCPDDMKGQNSMVPYFRYVITVDFTGWKEFSVPCDTFSGNYSPTWSRLGSVSFDCSGWTSDHLATDSSCVLYFTDITVTERRFEIVLPESVTDPYSSEHYDGITAKYKELLIGKPEGSTTEEFTARVNSIVNNCKKYWKTNSNSFEKTFVDVNTEDTLFGLDMSNRTNKNNVDEQKITAIYNNLLVMAEAYAMKSDANPYYHDAALLEDIKKGLEYTYLNYYGPTVWVDGVYGNWWHWDIGCPLSLTGILCILEHELGTELCKKYLEAFDYLNPLPNMTACNKVWITRCVLLSAALQHDPVRLLRSNLEVYDVFDYVVKGDGFYEDGSFVQHGNLSYTGGYGLSMINEITNIMYFMNGSRFEWTDPEVNNQYRWVFENFRPCVYNGNFMAAMRGREVSRSTSEASAQGTVVTSLIKMQSYAPADIKPQLEALIKHYMVMTGKNYANNVAPCLIDYAIALFANESIAPASDYNVTRVLGNMDRVVQHGPKYGVCISLSSTRIAKYESINRENQKAWYTGDGMIYLYTDGYDYNGTYFNNANPYLMPGVTANSSERLANCPSPHPMNSSPFAGGVEHGAYGASGFILGYDSSKISPSALGSNNAEKGTFTSDKATKITAKKSYFMFDNEVVCLGSDIKDESGTAVITTVENRMIRTGNTFAVNGSAVTLTETKKTVENAKTMHFSGMGGYIFLRSAEDGNTTGYKMSKSGNYSFLEITLSHGINPNGKTYAYVYLPEATAEETEAYNASPDIKLVKRNTKAHAVAETKLNMLGCVFFEKDTVVNNSGVTAVKSIAANNSCAVMVSTNASGETVITVSDPTQTLTAIVLDVSINASQVVSASDKVTATADGSSARIVVDCLGNHGQTYSVTLK